MTNREEYLNKLSNQDIAKLIGAYADYFEDEGCEEFCPIYQRRCNGCNCEMKIEKWLGEYADD